MDTDIKQLQTRVKDYNEVLELTQSHRKEWLKDRKAFISNTLQAIIQQTGLKASVIEKNNIENLEAIVLDLGRSSSGLAQNLENTDVKHTMIKNNGAIIYQQLFNGKIMVMITHPHIEGYGDPKPPAALQILRPDELTEAIIFAHVDQMLQALIEWEDYDDDAHNAKMAFEPIGFRHSVNVEEGNGTAEAKSS